MQFLLPSLLWFGFCFELRDREGEMGAHITSVSASPSRANNWIANEDIAFMRFHEISLRNLLVSILSAKPFRES